MELAAERTEAPNSLKPHPGESLTRRHPQPGMPHLGPGPHSWPWMGLGGMMAITGGSYRELNARVSVSLAGPLPPRLAGAVADPSPPPAAQHVATRPLPCCWSRARPSP